MPAAPPFSTFDRLSKLPLWLVPVLAICPAFHSTLQPRFGSVIFWSMYSLAWLLFIWLSLRSHRAFTRAREHFFTRAELCTHCAYDLHSLMPGDAQRSPRTKALSSSLAQSTVAIDPIRCPECGTMYQPAEADLQWLRRLYGKRAIDNADL